jgi:hypothetical protein
MGVPRSWSTRCVGNQLLHSGFRETVRTSPKRGDGATERPGLRMALGGHEVAQVLARRLRGLRTVRSYCCAEADDLAFGA